MDDVNIIVNKLHNAGFINLDIKKIYGDYFIGLEKSAYRIDELLNILDCIPKTSILGNYPQLGGNLYIRTNIKIN